VRNGVNFKKIETDFSAILLVSHLLSPHYLYRKQFIQMNGKVFHSTPLELVKDLDMNPIAVLSLLNRKAKSLGLKPTTPLLMQSSPLETGMGRLDKTLRGGVLNSTITELVGSPGIHGY
jgi:hypothetical protein